MGEEGTQSRKRRRDTGEGRKETVGEGNEIEGYIQEDYSLTTCSLSPATPALHPDCSPKRDGSSQRGLLPSAAAPAAGAVGG